jgi:uncharacterized RDD family membrane protein YckC
MASGKILQWLVKAHYTHFAHGRTDRRPQMAESSETLNIETPENVVFGFEIAGIGSRFLAALVDTSIIVLIQGIIVIGVTFLTNVLYGSTDWAAGDSAVWMFALIGLLLFAIFWGYYIFFEMLSNGQSPGKRIVGLRVLRSNGTPISLSESVIRNLVRLIDFMPVLYGIGVVTMFIDQRSRRLGDLAAGTLVIHELKSISLANIGSSQPLMLHTLATNEPINLPIDRLTAGELNMADEFLRRRQKLYNRSALALSIAASLSRRLGLADAPEDALDAEKLIEQVIQAQRKRYEKD